MSKTAMPADQSPSRNELPGLPRPDWMSKKHRDYLQRLMVRKGVLDIRLASTQLRDTQEIEKERNALQWAIEKLSAPPSERAEHPILTEIRFDNDCFVNGKYIKAGTVWKMNPVGPVPEAWTEWHGGDCPCAWDKKVEVRFRDGDEGHIGDAGDWIWGHSGEVDDIVAYRAAPAGTEKTR